MRALKDLSHWLEPGVHKGLAEYPKGHIFNFLTIFVGKYLVLQLLAVRPITIRFVFLCDVLRKKDSMYKRSPYISLY